MHSGPIAWVTFSPDGETVATLGFDGELTLVDPASGVARARARPGPASVNAAVEFQPDGAPWSSLLRTDMSSSSPLTPTCGSSTPAKSPDSDLTETEWSDAFGDRPYRQTCPTT